MPHSGRREHEGDKSAAHPSHAGSMLSHLFLKGFVESGGHPVLETFVCMPSCDDIVGQAFYDGHVEKCALSIEAGDPNCDVSGNER